MAVRTRHFLWFLPRAPIVTFSERGVQTLPVSVRVQAKEGTTSHLVASDALVDTILNGLHDRPGPRLGFLAFTRKLNLVERDKSVANASCPTEVIEGVFELCESDLLLSVDNTSEADRVPVLGIHLGGQPKFD